MATEIHVTFPGNLKVNAQIDNFELETDQPEKSGGDGTAVTPFTLFTTSIATCAGYFALKFCRSRKIETEGMSLGMKYEWDKDQKRYPKMAIELKLPPEFPEKYRKAIIRAMDQCVVKKHVLEPPEFDISVV